MLKLVPLILFLAAISSAAALDIDGYDPVLHDRFSSGFPSAPVPNANPSFIGAGFDLSGIGWNPSALEQGFVMISDRYFIYAQHFAPGPTISFLTPAGNVFTANVSGTSFQPTSSTFGAVGDFSVGMLTAPLDPGLGIASYPILSLPTFNAYVGLSMLVYGRGPGGSSPRLGTNTIDGFFAIDAAGPPANDSVVLDYSDSGAPTGEAFLIPGDSGSPSFVVVNGELAIVGSHYATDFVGGVPTSFDTFVPDYIASMNANGINPRVVPEPSSVALLALGLGALAVRRRR